MYQNIKEVFLSLKNIIIFIWIYKGGQVFPRRRLQEPKRSFLFLKRHFTRPMSCYETEEGVIIHFLKKQNETFWSLSAYFRPIWLEKMILVHCTLTNYVSSINHQKEVLETSKNYFWEVTFWWKMNSLIVIPICETNRSHWYKCCWEKFYFLKNHGHVPVHDITI